MDGISVMINSLTSTISKNENATAGTVGFRELLQLFGVYQKPSWSVKRANERGLKWILN